MVEMVLWSLSYRGGCREGTKCGRKQDVQEGRRELLQAGTVQQQRRKIRHDTVIWQAHEHTKNTITLLEIYVHIHSLLWTKAHQSFFHSLCPSLKTRWHTQPHHPRNRNQSILNYVRNTHIQSTGRKYYIVSTEATTITVTWFCMVHKYEYSCN